MGIGQHVRRLRRPRQPGRLLLAVPLGLIVTIVAADVLAPINTHLGPLLVVAPALTASFASPLATVVVGLLAGVALVAIGLLREGMTSQDLMAQLIAVLVISAVLALFRYAQHRRSVELVQVKRVSAAAQQAVLRPLPRRIGPLQVASLYMAAEDQALIGGDLYAAVRTERGTRLIIGDVMGKGTTAMGDAALLLGSFREAGSRLTDLGELMGHLDASVSRNLSESGEMEPSGEFFITALVVDIPDEAGTAHTVNSGHTPALLLRDGHAYRLDVAAAPPLGLRELVRPTFEKLPFTFGGTDVLLLYTDGITEARDPDGRFYPLAERAAAWSGEDPPTVVRSLREDLLRHVEGNLRDDAAVVAITYARPSA
jgi:serine phosphatase RsbU (regulator of sigma subunit)